MKAVCLLLSAGLLFRATLSANAQAGAAVVTHSNQSTAEVEDIGAVGEGDSSKDGKSTAPPPTKPSPFRFNAGARADYTTNAVLSGNHSTGDFIFFPNFEAGYHSVLGHGFSFDALTRIESGIYAIHDERTFIGYSLTTTLDWRLQPNLPRIFIGVEPHRYDGFDGQGRITSAIAPSVGTDWGIPLNNGNSLLFAGYSFTDYFSDPQIDNRLAHSVTVGFTHVLRKQLTAQFYYQYVHESFTSASDRQDSRHALGLTFTYQINKHLFSTLAGTFVDSDSNRHAASYQSAGLSLGLNYQY